jgi:hypothetical protein
MKPRSQLYVHYGLRGLVGGMLTGLTITGAVTALWRSRRRPAGPCPVCSRSR